MRFHSTTRRSQKIGAAAVVGGALALAACGSATSTPSSPAAAIHQSAKGLTSQTGISLRFSLGVTPAQAQQLAAAGSSPTHLTTQQAQALATGSIFFDISTGHNEPLASKQAATDSANNYDFGLSIGNNSPFEYRIVAQNIYLRILVSQFGSDIGSTPTSLSKLQSESSVANAEIPGISALASGQWVEVSHSALAPLLGIVKNLEAASGGGSQSAAANSDQYRSEYSDLSKDVATALRQNSTYAKVGSSGGRTEYTLTVQVKPFVTQVAAAVQTDLATLPGGVGKKYSTGLSGVAAKVKTGQTVVIQVYTESNRLEEIDVDLEQFASGSQKLSFPVPVRVVIGTDPTISAPSGATTLNLSKLPALLGGLAGSGSSSSPTVSGN
jgi:hypothetical protein